MGNEKLLLAAEAAGYAMVNHDDCDTIVRRPPPGPAQFEPQPEVLVTRKTKAEPKPSVAHDWINYLLNRQPTTR
jgi:hypothetical protein